MRAKRKKHEMNDGTLAIPQTEFERRRGLSAVPQSIEATDKPDEQLSWFGERLNEAGVIRDMAQTKPPGFYVNWTTVSGIILILSSIIGGWIFTYNMTYNAAYQKGIDDAEKKVILERLEKTEKDAKQAKDLQLYNQSAAEENKKKEKK